MKKKAADKVLAYKERIESLPLLIKILFLFVMAFILFFSALLVTNALEVYFAFILTFVLILATLCWFTVGRKSFMTVLGFWAFGSLIYLLIAVPRIYSGASLSPYLDLKIIKDRWLYTLAYPIRLLGTFSTGLVFIRITSPVEFLRWGSFGLKIALLFRAIQYATQAFNETRLALLMQDKWPEEQQGFIRFREAWLTIKYGPLLVGTTLRNIILWFPWAWLCFNKLQLNKKGDGK